jgi:hypothetical protein
MRQAAGQDHAGRSDHFALAVADDDERRVTGARAGQRARPQVDDAYVIVMKLRLSR